MEPEFLVRAWTNFSRGIRTFGEKVFFVYPVGS